MTGAILSEGETPVESVSAARSAPARAPEHNAAVDSLRGIAAAMIILFHMDFWGFPIIPGEAAVIGSLGVNLFFTLSGFLIARAVLMPSRFDRMKYLRNRSLRILPNYFICCFLMLFVVNGSTIAHATPGSLAFDLGMHGILMHGWFGSVANSVIGPLWTLSHEWIFYLLMAMAAPCLRSRRAWMVPLSMCVVALVGKYLVATRVWQPTTSRMNPLCMWDQFGLGIVGAMASLATAGWYRRALWLRLAAIVGVLVVGICFYMLYATAAAYHPVYLAAHPGPRSNGLANNYAVEFYQKRSNVVWYPFAFSAGVALILLAFTSGFQRLNGWLKKTPFPWMGKVSYSTYLYHMAVLLCLVRGFASAGEGTLFSHRGVAGAIALIGIYALSAFGFHFFEKPWLARKSAPAPGP